MICENTFEYIDELNQGDYSLVPLDVQEHLKSCGTCQNDLREWNKLEHLFTTAEPLPTPEGLSEEILARIEIDGTGEHKIISMSPWLVKMALAACLVFVVSLGFILSRSVRTSPEVLGLERKAHENFDVVVKEAKVSPPQYIVEVTLPSAQSVHIVGDFNNWQKESTPLIKDAQGNWTTTLQISSGYYQYQLYIDGKEFLKDPTNPRSVPDGFGGENSVILL